MVSLGVLVGRDRPNRQSCEDCIGFPSNSDRVYRVCMKLNDPFGRLQQKQQNQYESFRETLRHAGVDSPEEARKYLSNMRKNAFAVAGITCAVVMLVWLFFSNYAAVGVLLGALLMLWLASTLFLGNRHMRRYIDEELANDKAND